MSEIKTAHNGVEIVFDETREVWCFTLRGAERSAKSLANAKRAIDTPEKDGSPAFKPCTALCSSYSFGESGFASVRVTSIAEPAPYSGRLRYRLSTGEIANACALSQDTTGNKALIAEMVELRRQCAGLQAQIDRLHARLQPFKP